MDKFDAAPRTGDLAGLRAMVAPNIVMRSEDNVVKGVDTLIGRARISAMTDLKVERIAPVTVNGDFAATFIRAN